MKGEKEKSKSIKIHEMHTKPRADDPEVFDKLWIRIQPLTLQLLQL